MKYIILALCMLLPFSVNAQAQVHYTNVRGIIVQFKETAKIEQFKRNLPYLISQKLIFDKRLALKNFVVFKFISPIPKKIADKIVEQLIKNPFVKSAEVDVYLKRTFTPDDPLYVDQWHYYEDVGGINADEAWDTHTGQGVVVAVIDTGYVEHSDLASNIIGGYDFVDDAFNANDGDARDPDYSDPGDWTSWFTCGVSVPDDSSWHGTHTAGTIAAVTNNTQGVAGVAHDAKILVVRVLGRCGGSSSDIVDGIVWAAGGSVPNIPDNPNPAQVINMSLGGSGSCTSSYQAAIDFAYNNGVTVVVSAGNDNEDVVNQRPANCNNVIAVASNDRQGNRASYSNFGSLVDVTAPGGETDIKTNGVLSTLNTGVQGPDVESYEYYQGTSMSAPHVSGAAALLYEAQPNITPAEVEQILKDTARALPGSCSGGCGAGIIDARAALDSLTSEEQVPPEVSFIFIVDENTVTFVDTSTDDNNDIVSWSWNFGDLNTSTTQSPVNVYPFANVWEVELTVTDSQGNTATCGADVITFDPHVK